MCDGLVVENVAGGEGDLVASLQQPRDEGGEGEGDGLGDAGEVDQDRGAHHCSLIVLEQEMRQKEACRKSSVCLVAAQVSTYEFVLTRRGKGFQRVHSEHS